MDVCWVVGNSADSTVLRRVLKVSEVEGFEAGLGANEVQIASANKVQQRVQGKWMCSAVVTACNWEQRLS